MNKEENPQKFIEHMASFGRGSYLIVDTHDVVSIFLNFDVGMLGNVGYDLLHRSGKFRVKPVREEKVYFVGDIQPCSIHDH